MRATLLIPFALLPALALAEPPWGKADPKAGRELHTKANCASCHIRMYGGDGSKMYTRDGRMLSTQLELLQRVAACSAQNKAGWFPEEEAEVAAWLNQQYYHFDQ